MKKVVQMQPNTVLAFISENVCDVTVCQENGVTTSKKIEVEDFMKILGSSDSIINLQPSRMAPFEIGPNIIKMRYSDDGIIFNVFLPKGKYMFNNSGKRQKIHYPNMLFQVGISKSGQVIRTRLFAVKDDDVINSTVWGMTRFSIKEDAVMHVYPFGNVSKEGVICWGGNVFPGVSSYENVMEIVNLFLETPTTAHYCFAEFVEGDKRKSLLETFAKAEFDDRLLAISNFRYEQI